MATIPLLSLTQKPVQQSTFSYGGDDTTKGRSGPCGFVTQWELESHDDSFKAHVVFILKKMFEFLDFVRIGGCIYGIGGFDLELHMCKTYQTGLERNQQAREKIVASLGGAGDCSQIPIVQMNPTDLTDYLKLGEDYFRSGEGVVQGEDPAGRKFVVLRLVDQVTRQLYFATAHQRYRETCISSFSGGGSLWTCNFAATDREYVEVGTNQTAEFIEQVRTNRHAQFRIELKP